MVTLQRNPISKQLRCVLLFSLMEKIVGFTHSILGVNCFFSQFFYCDLWHRICGHDQWQDNQPNCVKSWFNGKELILTNVLNLEKIIERVSEWGRLKMLDILNLSFQLEGSIHWIITQSKVHNWNWDLSMVMQRQKQLNDCRYYNSTVLLVIYRTCN